MPISIGQWREKMETFNSCKYKTAFKYALSDSAVNLLLYKMIILMLFCCLHEFSDYRDYFDKILDFLWIFILIYDNFAI